MDHGHSLSGQSERKGEIILDSKDGRAHGRQKATEAGTRGARAGNREEVAAIRARQRAIGRELRRMYDDVVQEPVPEDFLELLQKIDAVADKKGRGTT